MPMTAYALSNQDSALIYGQLADSDALLVSCEAVRLHSGVAEAFAILKEQAASAGIILRIASGFRNFDRQLSIWNRKAAGQLNVLGSDGQVLDLAQLTEAERVFAILRWSALPGASRHHWGTDMDVFDGRDLPADYRLQLTTAEAYSQFARLHAWLDERMAKEGSAHGFIRPYQQDRGGIAPEPWHLSYAPLAEAFQRVFSLGQLAAILAATDIALKEAILANLDEIHHRFIALPYSIYPAKGV